MAVIAKAVSCAVVNIAFNTGVKYYLSDRIQPERSPVITSIVFVDTIMRIAIAHLLEIKFKPKQVGTLGHLVFACLTFCTQPLSVELVRRYHNKQKPKEKPIQPYTSLHHLVTMGYIFFAWKANVMAKDAVYVCFPSLTKPA